jgi:hypothetical protein
MPQALCDALLEDDLEMGLHALAQCSKAALSYADPESGATALHIAVMKDDHLWTQRLLWVSVGAPKLYWVICCVVECALSLFSFLSLLSLVG